MARTSGRAQFGFLQNSHTFAVEPVSFKFFEKELPLELERPEDLYQTMTFKSDQIFGFRNDGKEGFYYLIQGLAKLEILKPTPRILRLCVAGDLVGFGNWMGESPAKYQLVALHECKVQFWSRESFERLQNDYPDVNKLLIEHLIRVIHHKDERIAALESSSVENRVGHLILWMAAHFGKKNDDGILIDVQLDRDSMAQLAGTIPATLSRVLTQFEDDALIRRKRRQIVVIDINGLTKKL